MFNLAYYNIAVAAFIVFGWGSWLFPGADMGISVGLVGLVVDIPIIIGYSFLVMGMPRSGGDYVFVSRALSAPLGTGVAFVGLIFWAIFSYGQNAWFAVYTVLSPGLAVIGNSMKNPDIINLAVVVSQPNNTIAIGLVLVLVAFILTLVPTSTLHKVLLVLSPIALLGFPVLYVALLATASHDGFVQAFNAFGVQFGTSYTGIIDGAVKAGAVVAPFSFAASVAALPIVYATLAFPQSSVYAAGETKRPQGQIPLSLALGVVLICVSTWLMGLVTYGIFGFDFVQATAFYGFSGAAGYPLPAPPFTNLFFGIMFPNLWLNVFMTISALAWELLLMVMEAFVASRLIFSLAFDRVIPTTFADVSERFHTPVKANIVAGLVSIFFLVGSAYAFLGVYVNSIVAWTSIYLLVMVTSMVFPYIKKDLFRAFPSPANKKLGGLPYMTIAGFFGTIALLIVFYFLFNSPVVGISVGSLIGTSVIVLTYILGIIIYYVAKVYRKREGIDLAYAFKQIPPE